MAAEGVRGTRLHGDEPKRLELSDGSRLLLTGGEADGEPVNWRRVGGRTRDRLSVGEARSLAGDEFSDYVRVRTRAEAEWMRTIADWYRDQANHLTEQLESR